MRKPLKMIMATTAAALIGLVLTTTAGCSGTSAPPQPPPTAPVGTGSTGGSGPTAGATGLHWIINGATLKNLMSLDAGSGTVAAEFDNPGTYLVTNEANWAVPGGWTSSPTLSFTSFGALQSALSKPDLDPRIRAVLYDNENWSLTPPAEQQNPVHYDQLAAALAHQHNLIFIATPATDLVNVLSPAAAGQKVYTAFLATQIIGQIARYADVLDVQGQGSETSLSSYDSFIGSAAAQAKASNPNIIVLAGISTNPSGRAVTAAQVDSAIASVRGEVGGFWLNDPAGGAACPACQGPFPQVALNILQNLGS